MDGKTAYLALYLDAPLQSWGYQSRFDQRTTLSYPTRSGVMGILCAALGVDRSDRGGLGRLSSLEMTVYALRQSGRLTDYHTVGGGYDVDRDWRTCIPRKANGKKPARGKEVVQTYREYLQDSRFGVVLRGAQQLVQELDAALVAPRWGVWLGRKACVPASPIAQGVYEAEDAAVARLMHVSGCEVVEREVAEASTFADGNDTLMDMPLDFQERRFAPRRVDVG